MTSTIELDRPDTTSCSTARSRRGLRWLIGVVAVAAAGMTTIATATAFVVTRAGNRPLPTGTRTVQVYTVADEFSRPRHPARQRQRGRGRSSHPGHGRTGRG